MRKLCLLALLCAAVAFPAFPADTNGDGVIQILIPIAIPASRTVEGAFGSSWAQELWLDNSSTLPLPPIQPSGVCLPSPCTPAAQPGVMRRWPSFENNRMEGGAMFYVHTSIAPDIHFSSRLLELSRRAQPNGINIPLIREDQFFSDSSTFLGIPSSAGVRARLRVYDPRLQRGSQVRVEVFDEAGNSLGSAVMRPGSDTNVPNNPGEFFPWPGFDVIDLQVAFSAVQNVSRYHVRVTPLTMGMEYWAFVAVSDNETQHLTLITSD